MDTKTTLILLLSFLLASFLSLTVAYPHPKSLDLRGFSAATASTSSSSSSRTNTQSSRTKMNNANKQQQQQQKKKKEKEHDGPEAHSLESHEFETTGSDGGGDSEGERREPDDGNGGKKCPVPLPQRYAAGFENGHGCKKIAAAFAKCNVSDQWYCQNLSAQKGCLCGQVVYSDELVEQCYDYMVVENIRGAWNVGEYRGLCLG
ncbi:MAG: hypothetical protein Q9212_004249 [Teloschistes hypoglaucus]